MSFYKESPSNQVIEPENNKHGTGGDSRRQGPPPSERHEKPSDKKQEKK